MWMKLKKLLDYNFQYAVMKSPRQGGFSCFKENRIILKTGFRLLLLYYFTIFNNLRYETKSQSELVNSSVK
jgi:hypothetical protein